MPLPVGQPELVSDRGRVGWRCVDWRVASRRVAVLDRLQRVHTGGERCAEADRTELHRDGAVQLERLDRGCKAAARTQFNRSTYRLQEPVEHAARCQHGHCSIDVGEAVVRRNRVLAFRRVSANQGAGCVSG